MPYKLSIIIPCYNERNTIEEVIRRVNDAPVPQKQIIVVDDGSTDGTREILETRLKKYIDVLVCHEYNTGKGSALRSGIARANGEYVLVQDADLEYDPCDYQRLLEPVLANAADVVYGSRFLGDGNRSNGVFYWHSLGNRLLTSLSNIFSGLNLSDMETCYKLFKRDVLERIRLQEDGFGFEPEVTLKLSRIPEIRVFEVAVSYSARTYAEGKKINWRDGFRALYCIFRYGLLRLD